LLDEQAREQFRSMLRRLAAFCGIQIITYVVLSNHFHIEVRIQLPKEIDDEELLRRAEQFYRAKDPLLIALRQAWDRCKVLPEDLRMRLLARMGDVSVFMRELKQGFTRWFNKRHDRFGTLWAERFKSILVEGEPNAVSTVAAYIDLNAVRAGLVLDPKDYRFCGYGEAMGGSAAAREGLLSFMSHKDWDSGSAEYRQMLFVQGGSAGQSGKALLDRERILKVLKEGGRISCGEALRLRIRYLKDGLALGSEAYVEEIFLVFRNHFGPKRKTGARKLRGLPFVGLRTLRDLRVNVLS
jgi:hypothetical protein